jgi:hypothetical protein
LARFQKGNDFEKSIVAVAGLLILISGAHATTCTEAIAKCRMAGANKPNTVRKCRAAGNSCLKNGTFIRPASGTSWKNLRKE